MNYLSWLRRPSSKTACANTPGQFLNLSRTCMEQAQKMAAPSVLSSPPKANSELCKYLADQLKVAVESAHLFLLKVEQLSVQGTADCLDVFKLLHVLANVVESFIRSCCQDAWIEGAVLMPNVSERASSISFDLELLRHFFCESLTSIEVDDLYKTEVAIVRKKASRDTDASLREVNVLLRTKEKTCKEYQLAALLLERLRKPRQNWVAGSLSGVHRTDMKSVKQLEQLGSGAFGTVHKAMWLGVEVAKKTIYAPLSPDFEKEVSILARLCHPNIASLLCYGGHERECCMVMELMDGDLSAMMQKIMAEDRSLSYPFSIMEAVDIMLQIGGGMEYLHGMRIVHRGLKSMNILVRHVMAARQIDGRTKYVLAKLADFGLSKTKERSVTYGTQTFNQGTAQWMAPEVIRLVREDSKEIQVSDDTRIAKYPFSADVYSFGMVCYEILTAKRPFCEVWPPTEVRRKVLRGERPEVPGHCPPMLKRLIERCWSGDPKERPRFDEICVELRHLKCQLLMPWLQNAVISEATASTSAFNRSMEHEEYFTNSDLEIEEDSGLMPDMSSEAKIVVGLDLGTEYSGYAFAHKSKPEEVLTCIDWPGSVKPYCKTLSAIYYEPGDGRTAQVKSWGFPAWHDHREDMRRSKSVADSPEIGTYLAAFKLHLASKDGRVVPRELPEGFTVTQVIADYLREIGASIVSHLREKISGDITMNDIQWCVTVPSKWDDHAKKQMEVCMARAGLIRDANSPNGSPHPLSIVLEPEAASCYCHRNMPDLELKMGDRLLVADLGVRTTGVVVQEWMSETPDDFMMGTDSTGSCCGGLLNVDLDFRRFLNTEIEGFSEFHLFVGSSLMDIAKQWEEIKCRFGGLETLDETFEIQVPAKLAMKWEEWDKKHGYRSRSSYDELELTHSDMKGILDPVVEQSIALIAEQISRTGSVKVIFVVGGYANLPYLLTKIKERFFGTVETVFSPVEPGSAVCRGAVMLALNPARITSRIVRNTNEFYAQ